MRPLDKAYLFDRSIQKPIRWTWLVIGIGLMLAFGPGRMVHAAGTVTDCTNYSGTGGLQAALAGGGMVTFVCDGTIIVPEIVITSNTTIDATGHTITLSGNNINRVLRVSPGVTFELVKITIADGRADDGSGIFNDGGTVILNNSTISGNSAVIGSGGGVLNNGGTVTLTDSIVSGNTAVNDGGGTLNVSNGTMALINSIVSDNSASGRGGGILNVVGSTLTLINSTVSDNSAVFGGGIRNDGGEVTLDSSIVSGNSAITGGIHNGPSGKLMLTNSTVSGNNASDYGGGIFNGNSTATLTNSTISDNSADDGGGIFNINSGIVTLSDSTIFDNSANLNGGGIFNDSNSTLMLNNSTVSGNSAVTKSGGGIFNIRGGIITLTDSDVSDNSASGRGGGILNVIDSTVTLINSTVSGNSAFTGGGIRNDSSTVTLINSTVSGNSAGPGGGGIHSGPSGTATLTNSTISGNSASFIGGGIFNGNNNMMTLTNSTVSNNSADDGGGIYTDRGGLILSNSIVANSTSGGDCVNDLGNVSDVGYNIVEDGSCITVATSSNGDPKLGLLQDNGGPTFTHALLSGSPAIDKILVVDCTITTDQRGAARPQPAGGNCDTGAFEATSVEQIEALVVYINILVENDDLKTSHSQALTNKLDGALKQLAKGNTGAACDKLAGFRVQIEAFITDGEIDADIGYSLIEAANTAGAFCSR